MDIARTASSLRPNVLLMMMSLALPAALCALPAARAQGADPTRPPAAWLAAHPQAGVQASAAAAAPAEPTAGPVQIVVTGATRRFAMVDGHAVRVGETYNGARLVAINSDGVVWQREGGKETVSMSPGVHKREKGETAAGPKVSRTKKSTDGERQ